MALKKLLCLEGCPLGETEILRRIEEARQNHIDFLEFPSLGGNVRVKVGSVFLPGVMRGEDHAWNT